MAVTDLYIARFLLESTRCASEPLAWRADGAGAWNTHINGVAISVFHTHTMGWSGICLSLACGGDVVYIEEPRFAALFRRKYRDEDERRLAEALRELSRAIHSQTHDRRTRAPGLRDSIRETLYRRMLFGEP